MNAEYKAILERAKKNKKETKKLLGRLKSKKSAEVDKAFFKAHDNAFQKVDCLSCANCCKTTGPLFTHTDIKRISGKLGMKEGAFIDTYLKLDEDHDHVLQQVPCTFLDENNYCSIYEFRPKACREYPHTDRIKAQQIFHLTAKNAEVCPAVAKVLDEVKDKLEK